MLDCCISGLQEEEVILNKNLFTNSKLTCENKLLFLYGFLEKQGINIYKHENIIKNIRSLCNNCNSDIVDVKNVEFYLDVDIICSDNILAESFIIY